MDLAAKERTLGEELERQVLDAQCGELQSRIFVSQIQGESSEALAYSEQRCTSDLAGKQAQVDDLHRQTLAKDMALQHAHRDSPEVERLKTEYSALEAQLTTAKQELGAAKKNA